MASEVISQNSNKDTSISIPVTQLRKAIFLIEQGKLCEKENEIYGRLITNLEQKVSNRDSIIEKYKKNESDYKTMVLYYKDMYKNGEEVIRNLDENLRIHQKLIKRQKINKYLFAFGGFVLGLFIAK